MTTMQSGDILRQIDRLFAVGSVGGLSDAQLLARYIASREESAFVALVARHGPMVLAVCRGALRDPHAAEDAFQATFLILVRRAGSLWVGESLGGWLHRVAYRVALQARADAARRRVREIKSAEAIAPAEHPGRSDDVLRALLHEEIGRLPDRLRLPVVLCDLEGLTRDQAAERLRWSEGTVRGRLARARAKLRDRLTRRGVTLSAAATAAALTAEASAALVPDVLLTATARAAAGQGVTASAALLTAQVVRSMFLARVKAGAIVAVTAGAVAWVSVVVLADSEHPNPLGVPQANHAAAQPSAPPAKDQDASTLVFRGRVVDASDRPVAGASLYLIAEYRQKTPPLPRATTGADGRYRFSVSTSDFANPATSEYLVLARAEGFVVALSDLDEPANNRDLTLRVAEAMPIEGRVFDLEGRPVVGATVTVASVWAPPSGDLTPWLRATKAQEGDFRTIRAKYLRFWPLPINDAENDDIAPPDIFPRIPPATTDAQGRFRLSGVGRESVADLRIEAPSIRVLDVPVMTRRGDVIRTPSGDSVGFADKPPVRRSVTIYDAAPRLVATASRPIEGVVRDRETGRPVVGAMVESHFFADERTFNVIPNLRATSDASGHYRLTGMPCGPGNRMMVHSPSGQPYLPGIEEVEDQPGLGPIGHDITLTRGILIEGRVTSKATGKPIPARVRYYPAPDNPGLSTVPGFQRTTLGSAPDFVVGTDPDGTFKIAALPGRGLLTVATEDDAYPFVDGGDLAKLAEFGPAVASILVQAFARVDVPRGSGPFRQDLQVDPGLTLAGTILDPAGEPLTGAFIYGLSSFGDWGAAKGSSFELQIKAPRVAKRAEMPSKEQGNLPPPLASDRTLVFQHEGRKLAGWVDVGEKTAGPLRVKLEPWSTVSGRISDAADKPRADVDLVIHITDKPRLGDEGIEHRPDRVRTDATGRFRIEGLAPGLRYELFAQPSPGQRAWLDDTRSIKVAPTTPGESRDLGTVVIEFPDDQE